MKVSTADKKVIDDFLAHKENDSRILSSKGSSLNAKFGKEGIEIAKWDKESLSINDKHKETKDIVAILKQKANHGG